MKLVVLMNHCRRVVACWLTMGVGLVASYGLGMTYFILKVIEEIEQSPEHKWKQGLSPQEVQQIQQFYQERYESR